MNTATIHPKTNHTKSVIANIRSIGKLPFTDLLSKDAIDKHLSNATYRNRVFTPELTLYGFLSQAIGADQSCQAAICQIIAYLLSQEIEPPSSNTAAYCKARSRLPEEVLSGLAKESAQELEEQADPKWLWRGKHVKLMDGSTLSMPDTIENQETYPQPSTQKKESAFQLRVSLESFH